jgi:RNA polymerase sigma-70 factor (ECF subfamily)
MDTDIVDRARSGDRQAFDELASEAMPKIRGFLWRMVGHPEDCEDIAQTALAKAWKAVDSFDGNSAFATWLTAIASRTAIDFLRSQSRWRTESQVAYANLCAESEEWQGEVIGPMMEPGFSFDARQHVAYCFVCIGRSLPPDEQAALVLRDVMEFSNREAANVLGSSESVLRHRLSAARQAMESRYEGLCALVSKNGICHQCSGLGMAAEAVGARKADLPDVDSFAHRLELVREQNPERMSNRTLQDVFFRRCKQVEEAQLGSTTPDSGCGEEVS